jgi:hypothetical protein
MSPALHSDDPEIQKAAYELVLSLDKAGTKAAWKPLKGQFHQTSFLTTRLQLVRDFIKKHPELDNKELYEEIFGIPSHGEGEPKSSITEELTHLCNLAEELDQNHAAYNRIVLHRRAQEWGPRWGHKDVGGTPAYLAGKIHGRHAITHDEKEKVDPYNEVNVRIPKDKEGFQKEGQIEIAGFMIDSDILTRSKNGFSLDAAQAKKRMQAYQLEYDQLKEKEKIALSSGDGEEAKKIKDKLRKTEANLRECRCQVDFVKLAAFCAENNIPILSSKK